MISWHFCVMLFVILYSRSATSSCSYDDQCHGSKRCCSNKQCHSSCVPIIFIILFVLCLAIFILMVYWCCCRRRTREFNFQRFQNTLEGNTSTAKTSTTQIAPIATQGCTVPTDGSISVEQGHSNPALES